MILQGVVGVTFMGVAVQLWDCNLLKYGFFILTYPYQYHYGEISPTRISGTA
jgi:hypothetical protein